MEGEPAGLSRSEVFESIGHALAEAGSEGWEQIRLSYRATIQIDAARMESVDAEGRVTHVGAPDKAMDHLAELRSAMYQPGKGTWFTARFVLETSGAYSVEFDYDNEPDFIPQLTNGTYVLDHEYFPRDDSNTPDWLRAKLLDPQG